MSRTAKRSKTIQACQSCRKHKTRCEILDPSKIPVRCHRCRALGIECSYETTQVPTACPQPSHPSPSISGTPSRNPTPGSHHNTDSSRRLWSFVTPENKSLDWSAPMQAIQHLITPSGTLNPLPSAFVNNVCSLSMILAESRIHDLTELFHDQYAPWLNLEPIRHSKNPLVDIVCCAVAARHLEGPAGAEVRLRLQALARDSVTQMVFSPAAVDSLEAVQCLLISSLWGPFGVPEIQGRDAKSLISVAVRMALNLRLDHASAMVDKMRTRTSPDDIATLAEAAERARLWVALTNAESMLCLGTKHPPSSCRMPKDYDLIQFPMALDGQTDLRDVRAGLVARQFDLFEEGHKLCLHPGVDQEEWANHMNSILERMKGGRRLLMPLPVVLEADNVYFHALHVYQNICPLLLLYHAFLEARTSLPQIPLGQPWHSQFMPYAGGEGLLGTWARDMIQTCESLLVSALALPSPSLRTAPDALFSMVALAAGYLIGVKFLMLRTGAGRPLLGATDLLLAKTTGHLNRVGAACGEGHAAQRCALLMQTMVAKWDEALGARDAETGASYSTPSPPADKVKEKSNFHYWPQGASEDPVIPVPVVSSPVHEQLPLPQVAEVQFADVELMFLNSMFNAEDTDFWPWDALAAEQPRC
ncbi:hypothetical protein B0H11DRAFT_1856040 [Mycena galericulata]|nr:hypothetical protein B0H11DRAFT_1856040 [Mycena galericulata]